MQLFASNSQLLYVALLNAFGYKKLRLSPISPTFFANVAKLLGIEIEFVDIKLDFSADANVVHNFFETFTPEADIVFQNWGKSVGRAKVFVKKSEECLVAEFEDEEIYEKTALFLNGGIKKGRLWNYDVICVGIRDRARPCSVDESTIVKSNKVVAYFDEVFKGNIYFDTLSVGTKTLKTHYPILLKPSLYCPKEDIYQELQKRGVDMQVRFKPLYRLTLFQSEFLPVSEELYKAILLLPLDKSVVEPLFEVLQKYRHRGCSF